MPISAVVRRAAVLAVCLVVSMTAPSAGAEPDAEPPPGAVPPATVVPSGTPARLNTPDGWTLALGAKDERQVPVAPLTTAVSSREYLSSGIFVASLTGPETPHGILEVGYEIGCGIDMSTSNGVNMAGGAGITPSIGDGATVGPACHRFSAADHCAGTTAWSAWGSSPGSSSWCRWSEKSSRVQIPGSWSRLPHEDRRMRWPVVYPLLCDSDPSTDESDVVLSYIGTTKAV